MGNAELLRETALKFQALEMAREEQDWITLLAVAIWFLNNDCGEVLTDADKTLIALGLCEYCADISDKDIFVLISILCAHKMLGLTINFAHFKNLLQRAQKRWNCLSKKGKKKFYPYLAYLDLV